MHNPLIMRNPLIKWLLAATMAMVAARDKFNQAHGTGYRGASAPKFPKHKPAGSKFRRYAAMHRFGTMRGQIVTLEGARHGAR